MINNQPLIRSSESLRNISKTLTSFSKSLNTSTLLARDIAKTIQASNVQKKKIISKEQTFFVKRRESFLRKRREGLIEASGIKGALRSTGNTIKNTAKGFLGRLLSFIGIVFLGWIVLNVPKIIKAIQGIIKRITDVTSIMGNWVSGLREQLTNFGEATQKVLSDITGIDFSPEERSIQSGFDQSNRSLSKIDQDVVNDTNALQEPKTYGLEESDLKREKNEVPETQEDANKWYQNFMSGRDTPPSTQQGDASSSRTMTATPELYRIAAAMVTEAGGGTATTDVMQVLANRKASGRYTGYKGDNSYTGLLAADGQFQGVFDRGQDRFVAIQTAEEAAAFANTTVEEIQRRIDDLTNPQYVKDSAEFVKGAMEFRASPDGVRKANTDDNPSNNIEEIGTTGRIPESIYRGGRGDNQFLIGPRDAKRPEGAAPYNFDPKVSSTNIKTFTNITYTGKKTMPKVKTDKNGPVIVLQQQSQPNTQPVIMASSSSEESIPPFIASGADGLYIKLAALHAAYT